MNSTTSARADPGLLQRWRRQIASQQRRRAARGPRPLAAISYLTNGPAVNGLIDVRRLVLVALYDQPDGDNAPTIQVSGFSGCSVPWGVMFGGADQNRFDKNLCLAPGVNARGRRMDLAQAELMSLALQLDRQLRRHLNYPHMPHRRVPRLPKLWAAVDTAQISDVCREAQAFMEPGSNHCAQSVDVLAASRHQWAGLSLLPLESISHAWQRFVTVFADLRGFPKRQVFTMDDPATDLCGFDGAIEYDFFHSRFSTPSSRPGRGRRRSVAASAVA